MKAIVLISDRAFPPTSGSKVRNLHLWPAMQRLGVELRVLGLASSPASSSGASPPGESPAAGLIPGLDTEAFAHRREPLPLRAAHAFLYSYHQWPFCRELAARVDTLAREWRPDLIHAEELRMAAYLPSLRGAAAGGAREVVAFHNVESDLIRSTGSSPIRCGRGLVNRVHRWQLERFEGAVIARAGLCLAYSPVDRERYQRKYPRGRWGETRGGVQPVPGAAARQPAEKSALIAGSLGYQPNVEGLEWFLREVRPLLEPGIRVTVAGSRASGELRGKIAGAGLAFVDTPPDMAPLYAGHALSLVPLLSGSGTRGRILESLGHGRAVVTTGIGAEGLRLAGGVETHDSAEAFAGAVNALLSAPDRRAEMAAAGYAAVEEAYSWNVVAAELRRSWEEA